MKNFFYLLVSFTVVFSSCKKNEAAPQDGDDPQSASLWTKSSVFPDNAYRGGFGTPGHITLLTSGSGVETLIWDASQTDQVEAFKKASRAHGEIPSGFIGGLEYTTKSISNRFLVFNPGQAFGTLMIRPLDNNDKEAYTRIEGKSFDASFLAFEPMTAYGEDAIRISGNYVLVPYLRRKALEDEPYLCFVLICFRNKTSVDGEGRDFLQVESMKTVTRINGGSRFIGKVGDIVPLRDGFLVSTGTSATPQTCRIDLAAEVSSDYDISSGKFFYNKDASLIFGVSGQGELYKSTDLGDTWNGYSADFSGTISLVENQSFDENIVATFRNEIYLLQVVDDELQVRQLDNEGLPSETSISKVFNYGPDQIGLATSLGVYVKNKARFYNEK